MKNRVTLLCATVLGCTSLVLTACGGSMTEHEASTVEAEALASQGAELSSCDNWSGWYLDGSLICDVRLACGTVCTDYECAVNPASFKKEISHRVCHDQYGNYTHTEFQERKAGFVSCGC